MTQSQFTVRNRWIIARPRFWCWCTKQLTLFLSLYFRCFGYVTRSDACLYNCWQHALYVGLKWFAFWKARMTSFICPADVKHSNVWRDWFNQRKCNLSSLLVMIHLTPFSSWSDVRTRYLMSDDCRFSKCVVVVLLLSCKVFCKQARPPSNPDYEWLTCWFLVRKHLSL